MITTARILEPNCFNSEVVEINGKFVSSMLIELKKRQSLSVADLGEGPGGARASLIWVKKEEMTEGKMAAMASKSRPGPPLAQGLDPPLLITLPLKEMVIFLLS